MYFDWKTWGIWFTGFFILVVWIWIPIKEIRVIVRKKRRELVNAQIQTMEQK